MRHFQTSMWASSAGKPALLTALLLAIVSAYPATSSAAAQSGTRGTCTDIPLRLIVAPQTPGMGGISGDDVVLYTSTDQFNGGTVYQDGVGGVYVKFQVCNGTNDMIVNLRNTSPARYLNLDFSVQLAPADTADGAVTLTGSLHQQGEQINEMANSSLYTNGQFVTCSGFSLNALSSTLSGGNAWFKPATIYAPVVPDCNGGTGPDLANQPINTSAVQVQQVNTCTWNVAPVVDSTGVDRIGVAEVLSNKRTSTWVAGGQYQMPFAYQIQKVNCVALSGSTTRKQ